MENPSLCTLRYSSAYYRKRFPLSLLYFSTPILRSSSNADHNRFASSFGSSSLQGVLTAPFPHHQVYVDVFDSLPMVCALVLLNIVHHGRIPVGLETESPKKVKSSKGEKRWVKEGRKQGKREVSVIFIDQG